MISALACTDPGPFDIRYETDHLRIGTQFEHPLCGGDLSSFETQIEDLEQRLATTVEEPITLYLWDSAPSEYCGEGPQGCYDRASNTVHSTTLILDHELVHAVVGAFAEPPPFFSEGAAEALRRRRLVNLATPAIVANFEQNLDDVDYGSAGLFMRWLWERWGRESFVALLEDRRGPTEAFEAIYGMNPEAAEVLFLAELPYAYPPLVDCAHAELPRVGLDAWSESLVLDCTRSDVYGGAGEFATFRQFTVSDSGSYDIGVQGSSGTIRRCADEILETAPEDGDPTWGDVPPTTSNFRQQYVRKLTGDSSESLLLAPGRYELSIVDEPGATVALTVARNG